MSATIRHEGFRRWVVCFDRDDGGFGYCTTFSTRWTARREAKRWILCETIRRHSEVVR